MQRRRDGELGAPQSGGGLDITKIPVVKVTVQDAFGVPVAGAAVEASAKTQLTDAKGTALMVLDKPDLGTALKVSRESFVDKSIEVLATLGQVNEFTVVLERKTAPAGASLATRSGAVPTLDGTGRQLSFEVELVLVDSNAGPIEGLSQANFSLQACTPNPDNAHVDCVRGASTADDRAYAPLTAAPATLTLVGAGLARPYAAALLLDQSGSVQDTDPTGRIPVPVLTVKGIDDATAFVELDAAFKTTMEQAGTSGHLVQTFTRHSSHSYLSDPTYPTLMAALLRWVEEGTRPTPASIASECPALEATFGKGCAFVPEYSPAALNTRVPERAPQ